MGNSISGLIKRIVNSIYKIADPPTAPSLQPPSQKPQPDEAAAPGEITPCKYRYIYIWPKTGNSFWAFLTHVSNRNVSGFRWNGRRWVYFGMALSKIDSFVCY